MNKVLRVLVALPAIIFVVTAVRYVVDPAGAAAQFGMPLLEGVGRSSQLGDMTAYFLSLGIFILMALVTAKRSWYYPPIIMLALTAVFRILAWLLHDAALALDMIIPEVVIASLLLFAASRLPDKD